MIEFKRCVLNEELVSKVKLFLESHDSIFRVGLGVNFDDIDDTNYQLV